MFRCLRQQLPMVRAAGVVSCLMLCTHTVPAQSAPVSPDRPWRASAEISLEADARNIPDLRFILDPAKDVLACRS